ncbi:MAG: hypothetical protein FWD27_06100 [Coriobacteriia bacterium]|nr:hypothetical protein [Coriobacteriia bacterium]
MKLRLALCCVLVAVAACLCWILFAFEQKEDRQELPTPPTVAYASEVETPMREVSSFAVRPPFPFAQVERVDEYRHAETLESWRLISELSCSDYALAVLEYLHSQGLELLEAGYMDLSGQSWGCVFKGANNESFSVILMPERPLSPRSDTNRLVVNILHYLQPEDFS